MSLHEAIRSKQLDTVQQLITNGADVSAMVDGGNAVHLACSTSSNLDLLQAVLSSAQQYDANSPSADRLPVAINVGNDHKYQPSRLPLHLAEVYSDKEQARAKMTLLLDYGADVNAQTNDTKRRTPLHLTNPSIPIIELLLARGIGNQ